MTSVEAEVAAGRQGLSQCPRPWPSPSPPDLRPSARWSGCPEARSGWGPTTTTRRRPRRTTWPSTGSGSIGTPSPTTSSAASWGHGPRHGGRGPPDAADYPGADPELIVPASAVFQSPGRPVDLSNPYHWWTWCRGQLAPPVRAGQLAQGEGASRRARGLGRRRGVRAGGRARRCRPRPSGSGPRRRLDGAEFAWGDEWRPAGATSPTRGRASSPREPPPTATRDRAGRLVPAERVRAVRHGGNVWEWTSDWYQDHGEGQHACCAPATRRQGHHRTAPTTRRARRSPAR